MRLACTEPRQSVGGKHMVCEMEIKFKSWFLNVFSRKIIKLLNNDISHCQGLLYDLI